MRYTIFLDEHEIKDIEIPDADCDAPWKVNKARQRIAEEIGVSMRGLRFVPHWQRHRYFTDMSTGVCKKIDNK